MRGWTGAVEFFRPQGFDGVCSYQETNIKLTGSSANFAKEIVSNDINNKITIIEVSGNSASGYGYNVEWWDDNFRHVLECANRMYSKSTTDAVVELAKQIDSNIS